MMINPSPKTAPEKPWAILGISRRQYDTVKPWKRAKMSKDEFAKLICLVSPEAIKSLKEHADAERLIEAAFGERFVSDDE
jgi:hypothetical protein